MLSLNANEERGSHLDSAVKLVWEFIIITLQTYVVVTMLIDRGRYGMTYMEINKVQCVSHCPMCSPHVQHSAESGCFLWVSEGVWAVIAPYRR